MDARPLPLPFSQLPEMPHAALRTNSHYGDREAAAGGSRPLSGHGGPAPARASLEAHFQSRPEWLTTNAPAPQYHQVRTATAPQRKAYLPKEARGADDQAMHRNYVSLSAGPVSLLRAVPHGRGTD